jgi:heat-inducible transcriptional repressor
MKISQTADAVEDVLDVRLREVLREIVIQHVATGEPVSSRSLAKGGHFDLSSATLRNAMADLEDLGFLRHPHTSAGRVPTESGYRFFIDHLMRSHRLSQRERDAIEESVGSASGVEEMLHQASRLLARMSNQVGLVFMPTLIQLTMKSIDLIPVAERRLMCVIVGSNGIVVNRIIETSLRITREELERFSNRLTNEYAGWTLLSIREHLGRLLEEERSRHDESLRRMSILALEAIGDAMPSDSDLVLEGASSILDKPEFADTESLRKTLHALEEKERLVEFLNQFLDEAGLQILIGSENRFTESHNFGMVAMRYGSSLSPVGLVGIIGPMRMQYGRITPLVEYLGEVLGRKIDKHKGEA